jgi:dienelactone hydrolase
MKKTKVIFLGGAYRSGDLGSDGIYENLHHIRTINKYLAREGYAVICPNLSSAFSDGFITDFDLFLEGTKELLLRSDLAIFISNAHESSGCDIEKEFAKENQKNFFQLLRGSSSLEDEAKEAVFLANEYFSGRSK